MMHKAVHTAKTAGAHYLRLPKGQKSKCLLLEQVVSLLKQPLMTEHWPKSQARAYWFSNKAEGSSSSLTRWRSAHPQVDLVGHQVS